MRRNVFPPTANIKENKRTLPPSQVEDSSPSLLEDEYSSPEDADDILLCFARIERKDIVVSNHSTWRVEGRTSKRMRPTRHLLVVGIPAGRAEFVMVGA